MTKLIKSPPTTVKSHKNNKIISGYIRYLNSKTDEISIAPMTSPKSWEKPGQRPRFYKSTLVLNGKLTFTTKDKTFGVCKR